MKNVIDLRPKEYDPLHFLFCMDN